MTRDNSLRALVLAFCAVVACFVGSTAYTQWRMKRLDEAAFTIANVDTARIESLASLRGETHDLLQLLTDHLDRAAQGQSLDREGISAARDKLEVGLQSYRALPEDPSGPDRREEYEQRITVLNAAVERVLGELDRSDLVRARQVYDLDLRTAIDGTRTALMESIHRNAEHAQGLAHSIRSIRSASTAVAYGLNALSFLLGGIAIALAIAGVRRYTRLLESQRQLLERRAEELELFADRIAHDVLGPLTGLGAFLAILDRRLPEVEKNQLRKPMDLARNGLMRSSRLVNDLLDFARAGARPGDGESAEVIEVFRSVSQELQSLALESGVELRIDSPEEPCTISCRPGVLMSLIENLARNAIKYTADSPVRRVTVRAQPKRSSVRVEVVDTGPGLPPGAAALVFEPFVRTLSAEGKPGIGLGLATVKRLATAHDGSVGVESTPGLGCLFWFELPRAEAIARKKDVADAPRSPVPFS
ncbi:MAG TPA: ATP-binding protein [Myxococcaceae bacterium]|nr:ATP-binding protein [Myxococcaceae bacterium]